MDTTRRHIEPQVEDAKKRDWHKAVAEQYVTEALAKLERARRHYVQADCPTYASFAREATRTIEGSFLIHTPNVR